MTVPLPSKGSGEARARRSPDASNAPPDVGLDLEAWWPDLRALVLSRYADWIRREGLQLDDVLAEVALRIVASRVPFDPQRCAPAVYLLIQARSAIVDLARKEQRWSHLDPIEAAKADALQAPEEGPGNTLDAATEAVLAASEDLDVNDLPVVRLYLEGHTRSEIVAFTGLSEGQIRETIRAVRLVAGGLG